MCYESCKDWLKEINFSTGDQHARFVKVENVIRATRASVKGKLPVSIMIENIKNRMITRQSLEEHSDLIKVYQDFPNAWINIQESPWMPLSPSEKNEYADDTLVNSKNLAARSGLY